MLHIAPQELFGGECHNALSIVMRVVFPAKGHVRAIEGK
jgi:hypothetical protein